MRTCSYIFDNLALVTHYYKFKTLRDTLEGDRDITETEKVLVCVCAHTHMRASAGTVFDLSGACF
jgi:hypothetical protein